MALLLPETGRLWAEQVRAKTWSFVFDILNLRCLFDIPSRGVLFGPESALCMIQPLVMLGSVSSPDISLLNLYPLLNCHFLYWSSYTNCISSDSCRQLLTIQAQDNSLDRLHFYTTATPVPTCPLQACHNVDAESGVTFYLCPCSRDFQDLLTFGRKSQGTPLAFSLITLKTLSLVV